MLKRTGLVACVLFAAGVLAEGAPGDSDHDGVPDARDRCPNTAALKKLPADYKFGAAVNPERLDAVPRAWPVDERGCELDSDGDGVIDSRDYCPEDSPEALSRGVAENGCPRHSDGDGTPDYRDRCPGTPKGVKTDRYGCEIPPEKMSGDRKSR